MQPHIVTPPSPQPTYEQWFSNPFVQALTTSDSLGWHDVNIYSTDLTATHDLASAPQVNNDVLVLTLAGTSHAEARAGGHLLKACAVPGSLTIYPRNLDQPYGRWDAAVKALFVDIPRQRLVDTIASTAKGDPETVEFSLKFHFHDPVLHTLGLVLHRELQTSSMLGALYVESVTTLMMIHLISNYSNIAILPTVAKGIRGRMSPNQRRIVDEYIQANLHQKILLDDLAKCIHVGVSHFERMFRATFGYPPYYYVLQRRIERAKMLLCYTEKSLYEVARDCGFANQSHFTRHFTKFVGVSPARFMRGARSRE